MSSDRLTRRILVYDGDCGFCRRWTERWRARTGDRVAYLPLQTPGLLAALRIPPERARRSVQLVEPSGRRSQGAQAVFRALGRAPGMRLATWLGRLPPVRWLAEGVYHLVSTHRPLAARVDRRLFGVSTVPPKRRLVNALFQRALGGVYLAAFASLRRQVPGLYGQRGLLPVAELLDALARRDPATLRRLPTLLRLGASDAALLRWCRIGEVASTAMLLGIAPRTSAAVAWGTYLSFCTVGEDFMAFQWDALLCEAGLLALLLGPPDRRPPWLPSLLARWLAFRLHFESGLAKLRSGDPAWRRLTACAYHYETQPLPTRLGWYACHLPRWVHSASTALTLAIECGLPPLAFGPRRVRRGAFAILSGFQALLAATGNFAFFNLLTVTVSAWLLDDEVVARVLPGRAAGAARRPSPLRAGVSTLLAAPIALLSAAQFLRRFTRRFARRAPPAWLRRVQRLALQLRAVNSYGLFSVMTPVRAEVILEGSDDAVLWHEYELPYKPGDANRRPRLVAPLQPRLDWQMWFAALGRPPAWFARLIVRLLEGSPEVLALFAENPFPGRPPRYVRALLYEYHAADLATHRRTGAWWRRELLGVYFPPCSLPARTDPPRRSDRPAPGAAHRHGARATPGGKPRA